jgi:predicted dehydrogenase
LTAVHDIDLALWITGSTPVRVRALARGRAGADGPVLVQAQVETDDGGIWTIGSAYTHPDADPGAVSDRFEVHGSTSSLAVDSAAGGGDRSIGVDVAALLPADGGGALRAELAHFCRCAADGRSSDVVTLEDAVAGLACIEAIVRSAGDSGRVVEVEVPT